MLEPAKGFSVRVYFSERELKIIRWIAESKGRKWIWSELGVSRVRLSQLINTIFGKAGVEDQIALVRFAIRKGIIKP
jgi:DNA-binding CsgD family transcriptional regulator